MLVLQDVAEFSEEPLWHVRTFDLRSRRWLITQLRPGQPIDPGTDVENNQAADGMARAIISCASRSTGAGLIDLEHALCTSAVACRYRDATHIFYRDNQHHLEQHILQEWPARDAGADGAAMSGWL